MTITLQMVTSSPDKYQMTDLKHAQIRVTKNDQGPSGVEVSFSWFAEDDNEQSPINKDNWLNKFSALPDSDLDNIIVTAQTSIFPNGKNGVKIVETTISDQYATKTNFDVHIPNEDASNNSRDSHSIG